MATVTLEASGQNLAVRVAGVLDIDAAREAQGALLPALQATLPTVTLDASGLEELDLAGVQVLHWLRASALANGLHFKLAKSGPVLDAAARSLNLSDWRSAP
jgi:anti-anti-sigma regulatory factor